MSPAAGPGRRSRPRDERGEALPAAILFAGMMFTILVGIHVVIMALAQSAVQVAADGALAAAQTAGPGPDECDGDPGTDETARECAGRREAERAMQAQSGSVFQPHPARVTVETERGVVTVLVFGGAASPVFGGLEVTAEACGPLDNVPASELTGAGVWRC